MYLFGGCRSYSFGTMTSGSSAMSGYLKHVSGVEDFLLPVTNDRDYLLSVNFNGIAKFLASYRRFPFFLLYNYFDFPSTA